MPLELMHLADFHTINVSWQHNQITVKTCSENCSITKEYCVILTRTWVHEDYGTENQFHPTIFRVSIPIALSRFTGLHLIALPIEHNIYCNANHNSYFLNS